MSSGWTFFILHRWHICGTSAALEKARVKYSQGCNVNKVDGLLIIFEGKLILIRLLPHKNMNDPKWPQNHKYFWFERKCAASPATRSISQQSQRPWHLKATEDSTSQRHAHRGSVSRWSSSCTCSEFGCNQCHSTSGLTTSVSRLIRIVLVCFLALLCQVWAHAPISPGSKCCFWTLTLAKPLICLTTLFLTIVHVSSGVFF